MSRKVVVIGAGIGGCAVASLLATVGDNVTLLEAHPFPGGRCTTTEKQGFHYDFGVHMFSRGHLGPHGEVNRRLNGDLRWITRDPSCRVLGRVEFDFPLDIKSLLRQVKVARNLGIGIKSYVGAFRLIRSLIKGENVEVNDEMCLQDYISRFTDDEMIHLFINCLSQLYFALSYREASAGEFIWCFSRMFKDASFGYPVGGSGEIPRSFLRGLERFGGRAHFNEPVVSVDIENGTVRGVNTASGNYPADTVISNCGILCTIDLVGREHFPEDYVRKAEQYQYSNSYVTIKYALERPIIPYPVVFYMPDGPPDRVFRYVEEKTVPEDPYLFMPVPTNHDTTLAPNGKQLVIVGTAAPPQASDDLCSAILDRVHGKVCELFPHLEAAIIWQSRSGSTDAAELTGHYAGEAIGLAQIPGQAGRFRPEPDTPVAGLWLVGADVGSRGIGTEMAAGSALRLADILK
jgi:prolycopene isomerase